MTSEDDRWGPGKFLLRCYDSSFFFEREGVMIPLLFFLRGAPHYFKGPYFNDTSTIIRSKYKVGTGEAHQNPLSWASAARDGPLETSAAAPTFMYDPLRSLPWALVGSSGMGAAARDSYASSSGSSTFRFVH